MMYNSEYNKSARFLRNMGCEQDSDDSSCWRNPNIPSAPPQYIDEDGEIEIDM